MRNATLMQLFISFFALTSCWIFYHCYVGLTTFASFLEICCWSFVVLEKIEQSKILSFFEISWCNYTTWSLPYKFHYHCFNILLWSYLGLGKSISFHVHRSGVKNSEKSPALIVWSVSAFPKLTESNAIRLNYWRNYSSWKVLKTQPGFLYIQQYFYNGMQTNVFLFFFKQRCQCPMRINSIERVKPKKTKKNLSRSIYM